VKLKEEMPMAAMGWESAGTGDPVLLLGGPYPAALLRAYAVPAFRDAGFRVVTVDYRDPASDAPAPDSVEALADAVAALVDELGLAPLPVIGDHLGTLVTLEMAMRRPDIVGRLVLAAPRTTTTSVLAALLAEQADRLERELPIWEYGLSVVRILEFFGPRHLADDDLVADTLKTLATIPPGDRRDAPLARAAAAYHVDLARLETLDVAALVLAFEFDPLVPHHMSRDVARRIRRCRVEVLPTGHGGLFELPHEAAALVADFLRDC
jgi:pimeloyl-ACP methyl ester carboxylesterase